MLAATPGECFDALTDYGSLPNWQRALKRCEVLELDDDGLGRDVLYEVDARLRTVTYTLRHDYDPPHRIGSEYLRGDFRDFQGEWLFEDTADGVRAAVSARIDPGMLLPGPIVRMVNERVLGRALEDLRRYVSG